MRNKLIQIIYNLITIDAEKFICNIISETGWINNLSIKFLITNNVIEFSANWLIF